MQYMKHILWLLTRPLLMPFWTMRRRTIEEREAEIARYQREQAAALNELKVEFLLAHRQGMRDRVREERGESDA